MAGLFVVGNLTLSAGDTLIRDAAEDTGHVIDLISHADAEPANYATLYDFVMMSESVSAATILSKYRTGACGLIVYESGVWGAEQDLTGVRSSGATTTLTIADATHPIANGPHGAFSGTVTIFSASTQLSGAAASTVAAGAVDVATFPAVDRVVILAVPTGGTLVDSSAAQGPRAGVGLGAANTALLTPDGLALCVKNVIAWMAPAPANPPVADAGPNLSKTEGTPFGLTGSGTPSAPGNPMTFAWDEPIDLADPTDPTTGGTTPAAPAVTTFTLTVTDTVTGLSDTDTMTLTATNAPPIVSAGPNQTVTQGTVFTMAGTASDPMGSIASTVWEQIAGTTAALSNPAILGPTGTAPAPAGPSELLKYRLAGTDNDGAVTTSDVEITVVATGEPVGLWTEADITGTAPAGAAYYLDEIEILGCGTGEVHYVDDYERRVVGDYEGSFVIEPPTAAVTPATPAPIASGGSILLTCSAGGTQPLTYAWQNDAFGAFFNMPGETNPTHTHGPFGVEANGRKLRCVVTGPGGTVVSNAVTLTVTA